MSSSSSRTKLLVLVIAVALLPVAALLRATPAFALTERLANPGFESATNGEAWEWQEANKPMNDGSSSLYKCSPSCGQGHSDQVDARTVTDGSAGSVWTDTVEHHLGSQSTAIYPDWNGDFTSHPPVIEQEIPNAYLIGAHTNGTPNVSVTGYWKSSTTALGIRAYLRYATSCSGTGCNDMHGAACPTGQSCGNWIDTTCVYSTTTGVTTWTSFTVSCGSTTLPTSYLWESALIIEPYGTFGSGAKIYVDDLSVQTGAAATNPTPTWTGVGTGHTTSAIPSGDDVLGVSKRYTANAYGESTGGFPEVYAMKRDGTGAQRLTDTGRAYGPVASDPLDHNVVVATRFQLDWNNDDTWSILADPTELVVFDLAGHFEKVITPPWWSAGLGGVGWTPDGKYIVAGVNEGRYWHVVKFDAQNNFAWSYVDSDTDVCYESDANISNWGHWITYRKAKMVNHNCYLSDLTGDAVVVNLDNGIGGSPSLYPQSPTVVWGKGNGWTYTCGKGSTPSSCLGSDGFPLGAYDPGFTADDSTLVFSREHEDDNSDGLTSYDTVTYPVAGGTLKTYARYDSINASASPQPNWTWGLTPTVQWNTSVPASSQGIAFKIDYSSTLADYSYWGTASFNPTVEYSGTNGGMTNVETGLSTPKDGLAYPVFIVGAKPPPTTTTVHVAASCTYTHGDWAYVRDGNVVTASTCVNHEQDYAGFGLDKSVPANATIDAIAVQMNGLYVDSTAGTTSTVAVSISPTGTTFYGPISTATLGTSTNPIDPATQYVLSDATWGKTGGWAASDFASGNNFTVRLKFACTQTTGNCAVRNWMFDALSVKVYWHT